MYSCGLLTERSQGPRPPLPLSREHANTHAHTHTHTHTHTLMYVHTHTCKHASVRVGLAEISLMTLGSENDASSSSHPQPLPLNSQSGNTPGTCQHPSSFSLACGSPLPVGRRQPGLKPQMRDKGLSGFEAVLQNVTAHTDWLWRYGFRIDLNFTEKSES